MRKALVFLLLAMALFGGLFWGLSHVAGISGTPSSTSLASARGSASTATPTDDVEKAWAKVHAAPSDPNAWAELGNAEQAENDLVAAEHAYRTAIRMGGNNGAFADSARLATDRTTSINAITANGRVAMATAVVGQIVLADRVDDNVRVAVCDDCIDGGSDGLFGLDLVAAFGLRLDLANLAVTFADCDPSGR